VARGDSLLGKNFPVREQGDTHYDRIRKGWFLYWQIQPQDELDGVRELIEDNLENIPVSDRISALTFGGDLPFTESTKTKMAEDQAFMELILQEILTGNVAEITGFLERLHYVEIIKNFKNIPEQKRNEEYHAVVILNHAFMQKHPNIDLFDNHVLGGLLVRIRNLYLENSTGEIEDYVRFIRSDDSFYRQVLEHNRLVIRYLEAVKPEGDEFLYLFRDMLQENEQSVPIANRG
jgi:hypothetical protein